MISLRALAAVAVLLAAIPQCPLGSGADAPADAGAAKSTTTAPAAAACGATFTGGCFGGYQSSCPTQFAQCFGAHAASGASTGACATYGNCIGLFACATAKCKSACGA